MDFNLTTAEVRVLGCLIEKEITTPEYYPLTLNSLLAACNQKSNRSPVMALTEASVADALDGLRNRYRLVTEVNQAGSRALKYRHDLLKQFAFSPPETAVLCELMLRGPQTAAEIRARAKRMVELGSPADVKSVLDGLLSWGDDGTAFIARLSPHPGMREERFAHLLAGKPAALEPADTGETPPRRALAGDERLRMLEERVAELEQRLAALEQALS